MISDNFRLRSRISPERMEISKIGKLMYPHRSHSALGEKRFMNFGPLKTKLEMCIFDPPKSTFSEDHISAPWECCPQIFTRAWICYGLLAHIPPGTGSPAIFNNKHSQIGITFSVSAVITLGPGLTQLRFRSEVQNLNKQGRIVVPNKLLTVYIMKSYLICYYILITIFHTYCIPKFLKTKN